MSSPIVVVDYDPQWPEAFATIREVLQTALDGVPVIAIEHVGSTSVPGLAAKPTIDVDVIVARPHVGEAIAALESIGYQHLGDLGVPDRHALKAPRDAIRQNTYVIVEGCLSLRNHLGVREVLCGDPELRSEYSSVKRRLATETDDIDVYVEGKSDVIRRILERTGLA
ncbi:MAG: GrpB family protein, partial [Actinomycetota bacterium]|nr:GrpB family protein [Actinomycetota bacterium]